MDIYGYMDIFINLLIYITQPLLVCIPRRKPRPSARLQWKMASARSWLNFTHSRTQPLVFRKRGFTRILRVRRETGHTHKHTTRTTQHLRRQEKQVTHTTTRQEQHHKQTTTQTNPPTPHSTTLKGGATTVRTTTHARVGGRAEDSVGVTCENKPLSIFLSQAQNMAELTPPEDEGVCSLWVGGLTPGITQQDLRDAFYAHGEILKIIMKVLYVYICVYIYILMFK